MLSGGGSAKSLIPGTSPGVTININKFTHGPSGQYGLGNSRSSGQEPIAETNRLTSKAGPRPFSSLGPCSEAPEEVPFLGEHM